MTDTQKHTPSVLKEIIPNNLCVGCGLCVYSCPEKALIMDWDESGFLIPKLKSVCCTEGACLKACPFNPFPETEIATETEISKIFLTDSIKNNNQIGDYTSIYAGYSNEFRDTSSSGGLATYIIKELFDRNLINNVLTVKNSNQPGEHFRYSIINNTSELLSTSKTKYYPVSLATVLEEIDKIDNKVAIVGVGCFIKAIRIAQYHNPTLKEKIVFTVGIICGGIKSKFYSEYLAGKVGVQNAYITNPEFRIKDIESSANDYYFGCTNTQNQQKQSIRMLKVGDMWGTGLFKANACDLCDDVTTELADISLGDAWLEPYIKDGKGTNVIVTRTKLADNIIREGADNKRITVEILSLERFLHSQQGSFNHRHKGLSTRMKVLKSKGFISPPKRSRDNAKASFAFKLVQYQRMKVRKRSLEIWKMRADIDFFDEVMKHDIKKLKYATQLYHYIEKLSFNKLLKKVNNWKTHKDLTK